jgi:hypothetical protein
MPELERMQPRMSSLGSMDTVGEMKEDIHWWISVLNVVWSSPIRSSNCTIDTGTLGEVEMERPERKLITF